MLYVRDQVFIGYSHKDREWLERLQTMLKPLVRKNGISVWDDTKIGAGARWKEEIKRALGAAKVAVLLVTHNFLNSDFIAEHELPPLLDAAANEGLVILWVYVSSCLYDETEINDYQAAHDISKPLASLRRATRDAVLVDVCRKIKAAANQPKVPFPESSLKDAALKSAPATVLPPVSQEPELPPEPAPKLLSRKRDESHALYDHGHKLLTQSLPQEPVRFLEHEDEVREWVNFDSEVYKPGVITYKLLRGWWNKYNKGAIALFKRNRIAAIFAIWPLKRDAFKQILRGNKYEKQIGPSDILAETQSKRCRTWYVSGFAVRKGLCSPRELRQFLLKAIEKWKDNVFLSFPLELCAFGYSPDGERSLRRFGFCSEKLASEKRVWRPVYRLRIVDQEALQKNLSRFKIKRQSARAKTFARRRRAIAPGAGSTSRLA